MNDCCKLTSHRHKQNGNRIPFDRTSWKQRMAANWPISVEVDEDAAGCAQASDQRVQITRRLKQHDHSALRLTYFTGRLPTLRSGTNFTRTGTRIVHPNKTEETRYEWNCSNSEARVLKIVPIYVKACERTNRTGPVPIDQARYESARAIASFETTKERNG